MQGTNEYKSESLTGLMPGKKKTKWSEKLRQAHKYVCACMCKCEGEQQKE
jgi:hypothetical protein